MSDSGKYWVLSCLHNTLGGITTSHISTNDNTEAGEG